MRNAMSTRSSHIMVFNHWRPFQVIMRNDTLYLTRGAGGHFDIISTLNFRAALLFFLRLFIVPLEAYSEVLQLSESESRFASSSQSVSAALVSTIHSACILEEAQAQDAAVVRCRRSLPL